MARNALTASLQGKRLRSVMRTASGTNLAAITEHIEAGRIRAGVGRVLDLDAAAEAHRLGEAGAVRGKIVLKVR
jgi:NADPH:quinone reductase-like Zn-dependent oxidoreductase